MRLRVEFKKRDAVRFASHKDVIRIFQQCLAAAGIPVSYSRGFHPHMRMSFAPPIKTGWSGCAEYVDVHLEEPVESFSDRVNALLPGGLTVTRCEEVTGYGVPKLANDICAATYAVRIRIDDLDRAGEVDESALAAAEQAIKTQLTRAKAPDGKLPQITRVDVEKNDDDVCIEYTTTMHSGRVVAPQDVVCAACGNPDDFRVPIRVERTAQFVARNGQHLSPLDRKVIQG